MIRELVIGDNEDGLFIVIHGDVETVTQCCEVEHGECGVSALQSKGT